MKSKLTDGMARVKLAQQLDGLRPNNMTAQEFLLSPDLDFVAGPFSTFDPMLSRMARGAVSVGALREYMINHMNNLETVSAEYADNILVAARRVEPMRTFVRDNGVNIPVSIYAGFFQQVGAHMADMMGVRIPVPSILVVDSWAELPSVLMPSPESRHMIYGRYMVGKDGVGNVTRVIVLHRGNLVRELGAMAQKNLYIAMMMTFAHEFSHFVDDVAPNRGALGAQMAAISNTMPREDENVEEYSAHTIGRMVKNVVKNDNDR